MKKVGSIVTSSLLMIAMIFGIDCKPPARGNQQEKPNVLFIILDDMNISLGCYGDPVVQTPNIDALARRGVRFNRTYAQFSLCNPSRTSLLTGLRPETTGVLKNRANPRKHLKDTVFLPELFRGSGYFTARVGKVAHDKSPDPISWDLSEDATRPDSAVDPRCADKEICATNNKDEDEYDGKTARRVVELLEEKAGRPFFIAAGFHLPHSPWQAPSKYFDQYPVERMPLPEGFSYPKKMQDRIRAWRAAYYACVSFVDAQIGLILDALDRLQLARNTVVVFTSDHGFHLGEHGGMFDKKTLFEESVRVPLIILAPERAGGRTARGIVELVDIFPTLAQLCRLAPPEGLEGVSLVPLLDDPDLPWKRAAFSLTIKSKRSALYHSARTDRYAFIEQADGSEPELYDHETDPHETVNLAKDPARVETVREMRRVLSEGWRAALPPAL